MNLTEINKVYDFSGKTYVITGGAGVLGGEIACALVGCSANVVIMDKDPALAEEIVKRIDTRCGRLVVVYGDVLKPDTLKQAADETINVFGKIDGLINSAGGNHPDATTSADRSFFDLPVEAMKFVSDLNLLGTILPSQIFGKYMSVSGNGVILNISSMNAFRPLTKIPAYSAAKAAISNFTQWLAVHLAQEYSPDIRVNAIAPGFFLTKQNRFLLLDKETEEYTDRAKTILSHTPMNRFGKPEDLLGAVLWLLSPLSAFVTGIVLPIDGGFSAFSGV